MFVSIWTSLLMIWNFSRTRGSFFPDFASTSNESVDFSRFVLRLVFLFLAERVGVRRRLMGMLPETVL